MNRLRSLILTVLLATVACGTDVTAPPAEPVASVDVHAPALVLNEGSQIQLTATPRSADGSPLEGRSIVWSSGRPDVAEVSLTGLVTGVRPGRVTIRASSDDRAGDVELVVEPRPVARVAVAPAGDHTLREGDVLALSARVFAADDLELFDRLVVWTSSDGSVAVVASDGSARALSSGEAWITATVDGVWDRVRIVVAEATAWDEAQLSRVAGAPLPHTWQSFPITDANGVTITRTIRITAGAIRLDVSGRVYEQQTTMERWEEVYFFLDGRPVIIGTQLMETRDFEDQGTVSPIYEGSGSLVFASTRLFAHTFTGMATATGFDVTQRVYASGATLTLSFVW